MKSTLLIVAMLAACGHGMGVDIGSDDAPADGGGDEPDPFGAKCLQQGAECGEVLVGWSLKLADYPTECESIDGASVKVVVHPQANPGQAIEFTETCDGVFASPALLRDRYMIDVTVLDSHGNAIGDGEIDAAIEFANDTLSLNVEIDTHPRVHAGQMFGACSDGQPCSDPALICVPTGSGGSFCARKCQQDLLCEDFYDAYNAPADAHSFCEYTDGSSTQTVCYPHCSPTMACPGGMSCHDTVCVAD